jgi:hypothetical protein
MTGQQQKSPPPHLDAQGNNIEQQYGTVLLKIFSDAWNKSVMQLIAPLCKKIN